MRYLLHTGLPAFALVAAFAAAPAHADVVNYPNFNSAAGLTLAGSANTSADPGALQLTPSNYSQAGAAYSTTPITLGTNDSFSTQFQFRLDQAGGIAPADGITFVLAANPTGLGAPGGALGYGGVNNSVAIEFDTYDNGYTDGNSSNHVAIDTNGNLNDLALSNVYGIQYCGFGAGAGCLSNGDVWTALITYDGTSQNLNVTVTDPAEGASFNAVVNYGIDVASLLGTADAYVGFTAGTGSGTERQDVLNWEFSDTSTLPPVSDVPEPMSIALLATSLLGLGAVRRRKAA